MKCKHCGSQSSDGKGKCVICGRFMSEKQTETKEELLTLAQIKALFPNLPMRGLWYEIIDFSEREYSSNFGFYGFLNGANIFCSGGIYGSDIRKAGLEARIWKQAMYEKTHLIRRNTYGTGYMRQD